MFSILAGSTIGPGVVLKLKKPFLSIGETLVITFTFPGGRSFNMKSVIRVGMSEP